MKQYNYTVLYNGQVIGNKEVHSFTNFDEFYNEIVDVLETYPAKYMLGRTEDQAWYDGLELYTPRPLLCFVDTSGNPNPWVTAVYTECLMVWTSKVDDV